MIRPGKTVADDIKEVRLTEEAIRARIMELGKEITAAYEDKNLIVIGVLKGALMFIVDLARAIDLPLEIDFLAVSSYGQSNDSSGVVRIVKDLDSTIEDRHVLIVEDIVDTGMTLKHLKDVLETRNPASLRVCALLSKKKEHKVDVVLDYLGFEIPDEFVVGYGLDYADYYRNLRFVGLLRPDVTKKLKRRMPKRVIKRSGRSGG